MTDMLQALHLHPFPLHLPLLLPPSERLTRPHPLGHHTPTINSALPPRKPRLQVRGPHGARRALLHQQCGTAEDI